MLMKVELSHSDPVHYMTMRYSCERYIQCPPPPRNFFFFWNKVKKCAFIVIQIFSLIIHLHNKKDTLPNATFTLQAFLIINGFQTQKESCEIACS